MAVHVRSAFHMRTRCRHNNGAPPALGESSMDVNEAEIRINTSREGYLDRARELQPMLRAAGDEIERHRQLPEAIVEALVERGIFKMLLPRSIGGAELDPLTYTAVDRKSTRLNSS